MVYAFDGKGQFTDSFTDHDFINDPNWSGDAAKFIVNDTQLKLQAPAEAGLAFLSTPSLSINNAQWQFFVKFEFNPSASNYARIYLVSDQAELSAPLNGYFVLIGDTPDEVSLFRQTGTTMNKIIDGTDGTVNLSLVEVKIKVTRDNMGNWALFSDVGNSGSFVSQGTTFDNTFDASSYFGVLCNYTATRSDKFYFDDFIVTGDPFTDTSPPVLDQIDVITSNQLVLHFNEEIDPATAAEVNHYLVDNNVGMPSFANLLADLRSIELIFASPFENGVTHSIQVSGIRDMAGNTITSSSFSFLYFVSNPANEKDLIITEILADPIPQVGLPDAEYIEVLNRSAHPFDLNGWAFSDGNSVALLPSFIILPDQYWIITASTNVPKFGMTTNVMGVSNFPTLNNSSDTLTLKTPQGETIDSLNYNLTWYRSADKQEGGWALEIIDPNHSCGEEDNWTSSENDKGGTPGFLNSVFANKPDLTSPQISALDVLAIDKIRITFNEKLENPLSVETSIVPDPGSFDIHFETKALRVLIVSFNNPLSTRQLYQMTLSNIRDCSGNVINDEDGKISFAVPEPADEGDILINEILFNPRPNGVDFLELYNHSEKFIDLKNWSIANFHEGVVSTPKNISTKALTFAPGEYLVITTDPYVLKDHYPLSREEKFIQASLPALPDDEGSVAILSGSSTMIDHLHYNQKFHSAFVKEEEGVSLERISLFDDTNDANNWASASSTVGFATPGYINSNFRPDNHLSIGEVRVEPLIFSPQAPGLNFAQINFNFDQTGFVANIKIYDQQGRLIKTIANNAVLGFDGSFRWDGDHDDGSSARAGYYVVWFEVFNAQGALKSFRERVIIALR